MLDSGCLMLDARYWMLDTRYWMLDSGCLILEKSFTAEDAENAEKYSHELTRINTKYIAATDFTDYAEFK